MVSEEEAYAEAKTRGDRLESMTREIVYWNIIKWCNEKILEERKARGEA
jgi:hypothetical protein